jgi:hypothetical protein
VFSGSLERRKRSLLSLFGLKQKIKNNKKLKKKNCGERSQEKRQISFNKSKETK